MAHAAPARRTRGSGGSMDVFGERTHRTAEWAIPVVLGLVYGYWAAANRRDGGPITGWNLLFGFVTTIAFIALWMAIRRLTPFMRRELHALVWAAFAGSAFGFLFSQTGATVWRSVGWSLAIAAVCFVVMFYRYYTHEDAAGRRIS
ncbi:hypothetical protein ACWC24_03570 [Streptomyces sp. NPDC001443]